MVSSDLLLQVLDILGIMGSKLLTCNLSSFASENSCMLGEMLQWLTFKDWYSDLFQTVTFRTGSCYIRRPPTLQYH